MPWPTTALLDTTHLDAGSDNPGLARPALSASVSAVRALAESRASQAEAEAGAANDKLLTPLRGKQMIAATRATQAEAEAGTDNDKILTPLRGKQQIEALGQSLIVLAEYRTAAAHGAVVITLGPWGMIKTTYKGLILSIQPGETGKTSTIIQALTDEVIQYEEARPAFSGYRNWITTYNESIRFPFITVHTDNGSILRTLNDSLSIVRVQMNNNGFDPSPQKFQLLAW